MRIICQHGYFTFEESYVGEVSDFVDLYGLDIVQDKNNFTFKTLKGCPRQSLNGHNFLGYKANANYEGSTEDIFRANKIVYDFNVDKVVDISSISQSISLRAAGNRFVSDGLILPGSKTTDGLVVVGYQCWYSKYSSSWLYSGVEYE